MISNRIGNISTRPALVALLLLGIGLFVYSLTIPVYYTNVALKKQLDKERYIAMEFEFEQVAEIDAKIDLLQTTKASNEQKGTGLIVVAIVLLAFVWQYKAYRVGNLKSIKTVAKKKIYLLATFCWLAIIPSIFLQGLIDNLLHEYPGYFNLDDSFLILFLFILIVVCLFITIIILSITFNNNMEKAPLIAVPKPYTIKKIFHEIGFLFSLLINIAFLTSFIRTGNHLAIVAALAFTYILVAIRAVIMQKKKSSKPPYTTLDLLLQTSEADTKKGQR